MTKYKSKSKNRQAGGTFLGLILGLIIGLGIAVVVAVMIMKTPIPFSNKPVRPPEAVGAQIADPNLPLYGKATRSETPAPIVTPPNTVQAQETPPSRPSSAENSAPDAVKPDQWIYYLQAGAFRSRDDADSTRAKLALLGFEARISEHQSDQGTLYRVRMGPFPQLETMNRIRSKLTDNGVDAAVVRTTK